MPRIPSSAEITAAAVELGLIAEGEEVPPRLRAKVARTIQRRDELQVEVEADAERAAATDFVGPLATTYTDLVEAGIPEHAAARVVAAIAPQLWRDNRGAAHAPH